MGVDNLAEGQFTAHAEICLMVWEDRRWSPHWVHLAVLLRLVQCPYELTYVTHNRKHIVDKQTKSNNLKI